MEPLKRMDGTVVFITGGSRGIGLSIAKKLGSLGASVCLVAKTAVPHPKLPGTIFTAAKEVENAGSPGVLPIVTDIRDENAIERALAQCYEHFGAIDILINNASALHWKPTLDTSVKRYDLINQINTRGTWIVTRFALPYLLKSTRNASVLNLSPPLNMEERWFAPHTAYSISKYSMSMIVLGMAEEFRGRVRFNALWPRTAVATSAVLNTYGSEAAGACRKPEVMADSAAVILQGSDTGRFHIDDAVLLRAGCSVEQLEEYKWDKESPLMPDFFITMDEQLEGLPKPKL